LLLIVPIVVGILPVEVEVSGTQVEASGRTPKGSAAFIATPKKTLVRSASKSLSSNPA
jgi:hypothetical protein